MTKHPVPWLCALYFLAVPPFVYYIGVPGWIDGFFRLLLGTLWFAIGITLGVLLQPDEPGRR